MFKCSFTLCKMIESEDLKFDICSRCQVNRYCSKQCQTLDWKLSHKTTCGKKQTSFKELHSYLNKTGNTIVASVVEKYKKTNDLFYKGAININQKKIVFSEPTSEEILYYIDKHGKDNLIIYINEVNSDASTFILIPINSII